MKMKASIAVAAAAFLLLPAELLSGPAARAQGAPPASSPAVYPALPVRIATSLAGRASRQSVLAISITDAYDTPIPGAQIAASVENLSKRQENCQPPVEDLGNGLYRAVVPFGMSGSWLVTLVAQLPGIDKPQVVKTQLNVR